MKVREASAAYAVTATPQVPKGYKQTEVGVIPEDWNVATVGEISDVKTGPFGSALHEKDYVNDGTPIITVEHLGELGVLHSSFPQVSNTDRARLKAYCLRQGDIVFSRVGSVDRNALIKASEDGWLFSGRLLRVRPTRERIHSPYLSYHFHSETFKQRVRDVAVGQTMASINTRILMGVKAAIPPTKAEQEAIAEALSDADALIESLERLLAKKRHLKQGAMQELLTGKKRLPGFSGEWSKIRMGDVLSQPATYGIVTAGAFVQNGIKMLRGGDIVDGRVNTELPMVSRGKAAEYSRTTLMKNDVAIALVGYPGASAKIPDELIGANISRAVGLLRLNRKISPDYLVSFLNSAGGRRVVLAPSAGSAQQVVNLAALNKLEFPLPELDEQTTIAALLSDMDAEIAALEAKLAKARSLKQGMMQELLTGRIRLT